MLQRLTTVAAARAACESARGSGGVVGLVPTMGYLHEGHRALMRAARDECDFVLVTIFVNPLQFGANEDLSRYPRDLGADVEACSEERVDAIFAPPDVEIYPAYPQATTVTVAGLADALCGAVRPGHFDGVTTVVTKLFGIAGPCRAYFGRKDAQQLAVVRQMTTDLNLPVEVIGCPLVREPDGLARSSRNAYLSPSERALAPGVFAALRRGVARAEAGERDPEQIEAEVRAALDAIDGAVPQYVECRDAQTLQRRALLAGESLLAVAVHLGATRLIDNVGLSVTADGVVADLGVGWDAASDPARPA